MPIFIFCLIFVLLVVIVSCLFCKKVFNYVLIFLRQDKHTYVIYYNYFVVLSYCFVFGDLWMCSLLLQQNRKIQKSKKQWKFEYQIWWLRHKWWWWIFQIWRQWQSSSFTTSQEHNENKCLIFFFFVFFNLSQPFVFFESAAPSKIFCLSYLCTCPLPF